MRVTGNVRILERLVAQGLIKPEQQEAAISYQARMGGRIEEALLEVEALDEAALLRFLANLHRTRFVSTEKLSKADIDRFTLDKVPKKLAERELIFPVLYDHEKAVLSVVTPDPDNAAALHELQLASGAKEVVAFVGRPAAVRAAVNKAYSGDIHAFAVLDTQAHQQFTSMLNVYERNLMSEETLATALADEKGRERMLSGTELEKPAARGVKEEVTGESFVETLNVLVSLIENSRPDLRGHSAHVARLMRKIGEKIGVSEVERASFMVAAYLHDLGKMGAYHLTALNVAEYEGHRAAANTAHRSPVRLMEAVELPRGVAAAIGGMYERYDGKGFPAGAAGKDIPLGARLLAIADTYADLTQNPRNPFRKALRPMQACEVLGRYKGAIFDPNLVDLFRHAVTGDDVKSRLLADRHLVLLVDPDPEETTVLELRLIEAGFEVLIARTADQALKTLERGDVEFVVSELDIEPSDGFALLSSARRQPGCDRLPWVIMTRRTGRTEAQRAFDLGAADYMTKPVASDVLIAKMRQILERESSGRARGVSGSLQEMSLPDMVQVLWHGRKTGSLKIRSSGEAGEIHFVGGQIYNAMWGKLRGEEAFYSMITLKQGEFVLDPNFTATAQAISASPEALLLEGMRRHDEANAGRA